MRAVSLAVLFAGVALAAEPRRKPQDPVMCGRAIVELAEAAFNAGVRQIPIPAKDCPRALVPWPYSWVCIDHQKNLVDGLTGRRVMALLGTKCPARKTKIKKKRRLR